MLRFWRNPEFVRYRRSELRPARALIVAILAFIVCTLTGFVCWMAWRSELQQAKYLAAYPSDGFYLDRVVQLQQHAFAHISYLFFRAMIFIQAGVLTFWSLFACAQSISGERDRKTWDFQRTTRLSAAELLVGKLLGCPVLAYFVAICCFPIIVAAGLIGGAHVSEMLSAYVLIIGAALFLGLAGLWLSTLMEDRSHGIGVIGALGLYVLVLASYGLLQSPFPGLAAFSPLTDLLALLRTPAMDARVFPRLFGFSLSWTLMSLLLYVTFGTWLVMMTVKNLKRDYGDLRPLSRWQAVGCAAFLDLVLYALYYARAAELSFERYPSEFRPDEYAVALIVIYGLILFVVGLAMLMPSEHLISWRKRLGGRIFAEDGLPWPWILLCALVSYVFLMAFEFSSWKGRPPASLHPLAIVGFDWLVISTFAFRDVLFIQWCKMTRLRSPVIKGFLWLCLYYVGASIVIGAFGTWETPSWIASLLTPFGALGLRFSESDLQPWTSLLVGWAFQIVVIAALFRAIFIRLRVPTAPAAAQD